MKMWLESHLIHTPFSVNTSYALSKCITNNTIIADIRPLFQCHQAAAAGELGLKRVVLALNKQCTLLKSSVMMHFTHNANS